MLIGPIGPEGRGTSARDGLRLPLILVGLGICALPILAPNLAGNATPADGLIALAILGVLLWAGTTRQPLALPYGLGVGVMAIAGLVASLAGAFPLLGLVAVLQDLFLLVWCAAVANVARRPGAIEVLTRTWVVSSLLWATAFIVATTGTTVSAGSDAVRAGFVFGEQNGAGLYFVLSLFVLLAVRRPRRRSLRVAAILLLLLATVYTGSLGALSGLLLGLAVATVGGVLSRRGTVPALAVGVALLLAAGSLTLLANRDSLVTAAHDSSNSLVRNSIGRGSQSSSERKTLSEETLRLWRTSGALGLGPGATKDVLMAQQAPYPKEAHDDWVAAVIERGLLGGLGLLLLVGEVVLHASRAWDPLRLLAGFRVVMPAPAFLVGALGCVLVFSFTHEVLHDRTAWTLFALVAAVALWGRAKPLPQGGSA